MIPSKWKAIPGYLTNGLGENHENKKTNSYQFLAQTQFPEHEKGLPIHYSAS
jgi:hypothetical protein